MVLGGILTLNNLLRGKATENVNGLNMGEGKAIYNVNMFTKFCM